MRHHPTRTGPRHACRARWGGRARARAVPLAALVLAACLASEQGDLRAPRPGVTREAAAGTATAAPTAQDVYAATGAGMLGELARRGLPRVYVPNSIDGTVSIIDPATYAVIDTVRVGRLPEHVVVSHDLTTLWVASTAGNALTAIDPLTGQAGRRLDVFDPYNLYFTPDGRSAIVVAERGQRLDWRDPRTMDSLASTPTPCRGPNHLDYTADGRHALLSCEFSGEVLRLDLSRRTVTGKLALVRPPEHGGDTGSMPQDVRLSPDGAVFFVADMMADGLFVIAADSLAQLGFIPTGKGAHGITVGRGGTRFYISNRGWHTVYGGRKGPGSISVLDPIARRVEATWPIPGGGSPDMGNVTADGRELWVGGRYDHEVYVFDLVAGAFKTRIPVGKGPHGLAVWPQPGRWSLGHTGNMR